MSSEKQQAEFYDRYCSLHLEHFDEPCTQTYRRRFIYNPIFEGIDFSRMKVLEAMRGSGQTTQYLLSQGAEVTGLDISRNQVDTFRKRRAECDAVCSSITQTDLESETFDCVIVNGGLHHVHPHLGEAIEEIHRILKPGGHFCLSEPHEGSLPNLARRAWYSLDPIFLPNEKAIDLDDMKGKFGSRFRFNKNIYQGNIAFLLVYNSMAFRIPPRLKPYCTPFLMALEALLGRFQTKLTSCNVIGQWQKNAAQ